MLNWLKRLKRIVDFYDADRFKLEEEFKARIKILESILIKDTTIGLDLTHNVQHALLTNVVVIGRYQDRDIVEIFSMPPNDFAYTVRQLRDLEKRGRVQYVDAPTAIKVVLKRSTEGW